RTLGGATTAAIQGCVVLIVTILVGFRPVSWLLVLPAALVMLLIGVLFSGLGIMVASKLRDMQGFQLIMNFLVMPLFFLSGALFPLTSVPTILAGLTQIDPLSYGIDSFRALLVNTSHFGLATDFTVLIIFTIVFLGAGS